jgi:hypothetical protein
MQFKNIFLFGLLGGALGNAITDGFTAIGGALDTLDAAVAGLSDGANVAAATADVKSKSSGVAAAIQQATSNIKAGAALSIVEAANILAPSKVLLGKTKKVIDDLIAKKAIITKAGQAGTVKEQLGNQQTVANDLVAAIISKVPAATQAIAKNQAGEISKEIARGLAAFS